MSTVQIHVAHCLVSFLSSVLALFTMALAFRAVEANAMKFSINTISENILWMFYSHVLRNKHMPRSYKSCSLVCKQKTFFFKERRKFLFKKCIYKLEKSYSTKAERVTLRTTELSMLFVYLFITTSGKKKQKQIPVLKHNLVTGNYCKKKKKTRAGVEVPVIPAGLETRRLQVWEQPWKHRTWLKINTNKLIKMAENIGQCFLMQLPYWQRGRGTRDGKGGKREEVKINSYCSARNFVWHRNAKYC